VVDDDPIACELLQEGLGSAGIEAHTTTDSSQAATRLRKEKFDAVFLDLGMPSPDGVELAKQMRASGLNRATPIVMITGEEDRAVLTRVFQAGANFLLFKPVARQSLLRLIRVTQGLIERERRRFTRMKLPLKVSIESGQERLNGTTLDISLSGILAEAEEVFPVGTRVQVGLALAPGSPPLDVPARVVRLGQHNRMGLQFESIGAAASERLQEFLLPLILAAHDTKSRASTPA